MFWSFFLELFIVILLLNPHNVSQWVLCLVVLRIYMLKNRYLFKDYLKSLNSTLKNQLESAHCMHGQSQPTIVWKYLEKNVIIVADMYCVFRPMMVVSELNMYTIFLSLFYKQYSVTTVCIAFTLQYYYK